MRSSNLPTSPNTKAGNQQQQQNVAGKSAAATNLLGGNFASSAVAAGKRRQQEREQQQQHQQHNVPSMQSFLSGGGHNDPTSMLSTTMLPGTTNRVAVGGNSNNSQGETFDVLEIDLALFSSTQKNNSSSSNSATSHQQFLGNQSITRERRVEFLPNVVLLRNLTRKVISSRNTNTNLNTSDGGNLLGEENDHQQMSRDKEVVSGGVVCAVAASEDPRVVLYLDSGWFHFLDRTGNDSHMLVLPKKKDVKNFANFIEKYLLSSTGGASQSSPSSRSTHNTKSKILFSPRMSGEVRLPLGSSYPMHPVFVGEDGEIKDQQRIILSSALHQQQQQQHESNTTDDSDGKDGEENSATNADGSSTSILDSVLKRAENSKILAGRNSNSNSSSSTKADLSMIRDLELRKLLEVSNADASDVNTFLNFGVTPLAPAIVEAAQALLIACQSSSPASSTVIKLAETVTLSLKTHEISGRMHLAMPVCEAAILCFHALLQLANNSPMACSQDGAGDAIVISIERCVSCLLVGGFESCLGLPDEEYERKQKENAQNRNKNNNNPNMMKNSSFADNNNQNGKQNREQQPEGGSAPPPPSRLCRELTQHLATALVLIENYHAILSDRISVTQLWAKNNGMYNSSSRNGVTFDDLLERFEQEDSKYSFRNRGSGARKTASSSAKNQNSSSSQKNQLVLMWVSATAPIVHRGFLLMSSLITPLPQLPNQVLHNNLANMFPSNLTQATYSTSSTYLNSSSSAAKTKNIDAFVSLHCCLSLSKIATKILISWTEKAMDQHHYEMEMNNNNNNNNNNSSSSFPITSLSGQVVLRSCATALTLCTNLLENSMSERSLATITSRSIVNRESAASNAMRLLSSKSWELDSKEAMLWIFHLHTRLSEVVAYLSTNHHHVLLTPKIEEELVFGGGGGGNNHQNSTNNRYFSSAADTTKQTSSSTSPLVSFMCWDQVIVALSTPLRRSAAWFGSLFPPTTRNPNGGEKKSSSNNKSGGGDFMDFFDPDEYEDSYFNHQSKSSSGGTQNENEEDSSSSLSNSMQQDLREMMARSACRFLAARASVEGLTSTSVLINTVSAEINNALFTFYKYKTSSRFTHHRFSSSPSEADRGNKNSFNYFAKHNNDHSSSGLYHLQHIILPTMDFQPGAVWLVRCAVLCGASTLRQEMIGTAAVLVRLQMLAIQRSGRAVTPKNVFGPILNKVRKYYGGDEHEYYSNENNTHNEDNTSGSSTDIRNNSSPSKTSDVAYLSSSLSSIHLSSISHLSRVERVWSRWCSQLNAVVGACPQPSTAHSVWSTASLIVHRFAQSAVIILQKSSGVSLKMMTNKNNNKSSPSQFFATSEESSSWSPSVNFASDSFLQKHHHNSTASNSSSNPPLLCATMILSVPSTETLRTFSSPEVSSGFIDENIDGGGQQQYSADQDDDDDADNILFFGSWRDDNNNNMNGGHSSRFFQLSRSSRAAFTNSSSSNSSKKPPDAQTYLTADSWDGLAEFENDRPTMSTTSKNGFLDGDDEEDGESMMKNDNDDYNEDEEMFSLAASDHHQNYYLSARYDQIDGRNKATTTNRRRHRQHFSLSLSPNVQDEAFWYVDKSCEDRQEELRLMTASRRRLQAVQDARDAAAAPPSRCAVFAARAIRDFARAFFRTSQDVFDDDFYLANQHHGSNNLNASPAAFQFSSSKIAQKFMAAAAKAKRNQGATTTTTKDHGSSSNAGSPSFLTISLICQELSNLFFFGSGSLQHACLSLLPILACIRQSGDEEERRSGSASVGGGDHQSYQPMNNNNNNRPSPLLLLGGGAFDPSLGSRFGTGNNNIENNNATPRRAQSPSTATTKQRQQPLKKESVLISTLRSQRMLNQS